MIRLENITKIYNEKVDDTKALDDVSTDAVDRTVEVVETDVSTVECVGTNQL